MLILQERVPVHVLSYRSSSVVLFRQPYLLFNLLPNLVADLRHQHTPCFAFFAVTFFEFVDVLDNVIIYSVFFPNSCLFQISLDFLPH